MSPRTVQRARDRLVKAGRIECDPGTGTAQSTWRFLFPQTCSSGDTQDVHTEAASDDTQDVHTEPGGDINVATLEPGRGDNRAASGDIHERATRLSETSAEGGSVGEGLSRAHAHARDDDDQDRTYIRGPGPRTQALSGRIWPPGSRRAAEGKPVSMRASDRPPAATELCRRCGAQIGSARHPGTDCPTVEAAPRRAPGGPASWAAPRGNPAPEVAVEGRKRIDAAIAAARAERGTPAPAVTRPRTDDERRELALRQVAAARHERAAPAAEEEESGDAEEPPF
jgi:hypothetical protein